MNGNELITIKKFNLKREFFFEGQIFAAYQFVSKEKIK